MGKYNLSGSILILLTVALIISNLSGCIKGSEDSQYEISDLGKFIGIWVSNSSEISFFPNGTFSSTGGNGTFGIDEGKLCMQYPSKIYELSYTFHNDTTLFIEDTNGNITIYIKQNKFVGTWIGNKEIYISTRRRNMSVYITELTFTEDTVNMTTEGEKGIRNMSGTYTAEGNELIMKISFGSSPSGHQMQGGSQREYTDFSFAYYFGQGYDILYIEEVPFTKI